jgi:hypothetical protein
LCGHFAPKRIRIDVVDERPLSVDLDHRQPLSIPGLERRIPADVDLRQVERDLFADLLENPPGTLAQVTALRVEENDFRLAGPLTDRCRA